jgi:UDP-arabinose 4-epimerase
MESTLPRKDKVVLVTGGAGYIGSHACKALADAGYTPITFDNMVYGHPWAVRWGPLEQGDISDLNRLNEVLSAYKPSAIMHFAAYAYVGESVSNPGKYYRNNVAGSLSLLEAARDFGIKNFIFSSTCATYGTPNVVPVNEDHPQNPINPYGSSKLMIEQILKDFDVAHGIKSISLRYFNAAGADPECLIGESHQPETHLIPLVLDAALGRRSAIQIYGDNYDTPDGTCIRDYIHVSDLANAHVKALNALESGSASTAYNLGNGKGFSVREVIAAAEAVTGLRVPIEISPRRSGDPAQLIGDASKAKSELGWAPKFEKLNDILETAWRWHQIQSFKEM